jgi:DNA-binding transcriptional MerR regulator
VGADQSALSYAGKRFPDMKAHFHPVALDFAATSTSTVSGVSWSIAQVARLSGVTSRTLRHYDDIGLLKPARIGANGYRYYERDELLRLQEILVLRELGIGLDVIGKTLDGEQDRLDALRRHRDRLLAERDRYARLAESVARSIEELEGGDEMAAEQLFEGFDQAQYEDEVKERWGHTEAYAESKRKVAAMTKEDATRLQAEEKALVSELAEVFRAGAPVDDARTQALVDRHYRWFCSFWTPTWDTYVCIGNMYVDDARFTAHYDAHAPGLAVYLRDAMKVYAESRKS